MKTADISGPVDAIVEGPVKPQVLKTPKVTIKKKTPKVVKKTQGAEAIMAENLAKVLAFLETYGRGRPGKRKVSKKA